MNQPPEPVVLECRSKPSITREEIEQIVRRRALVARELRWLRAEGRRLLQALELGATVEPGPVPVGIERGWHGVARYSRLMVDGRSIDEV